ncbi:speckle-type POZ protein A [Nephila pilipes]|uniref:Speckle-type POZ protein A n=1 Tax=Nephila pilipes TaxID=299642 RepID=A0A8X6NPN5_NEPPI|nr:speckle-type POZ protein A [Nephila pilipes]
MASSNAAAESEAWLTFFWNIENFSYCWQKKDEYIKSPTFVVESIESSNWRFQLNPRGFDDENFIQYFVIRQWNNGVEVNRIEWELAILAEDGSVFARNERGRPIFHKNRIFLRASAKRKDVTKTKREAVLSRDTLRIRCKVWRTDGSTVTPSTFVARTVLKVMTMKFLWDIERFSSLESGHKVPYVSWKGVGANFNIGVDEENNIMIFIEPFDKNTRFFTFQSYLIDTNGIKTDYGKREFWPSEINSYSLPFTKQISLDEKTLYVKNDVLSLYCEYTWCDGIASEAIENFYVGITSPLNRYPIMPTAHLANADVEKMVDLRKDFECLYVEGILSDVELRTATRTFPAHKAILSSRSPVFLAMFTTDMKEKVQECVDVPDVEDDILRRMLLYVYTNALEGLLQESALKLYAAADKYEIVTLKSKCRSFLKRTLCPNNLCDVLVLGDMHADDDLKAAAQEYALEHERDVFCSDVWKAFTKTNHVLAAETMLLKWNINYIWSCNTGTRGIHKKQNAPDEETGRGTVTEWNDSRAHCAEPRENRPMRASRVGETRVTSWQEEQ